MSIFITFEGLDASGKGTQFRLLIERLRRANREFIATREPGGTEHGERIRELLLMPAKEEMSPVTEAYLFAAARAEHRDKKILPALAASIPVLCDRYVDSSLAFQGYGHGLSLELLRHINGPVIIEPTLTILLDVPAEESVSRVQQRAGGKDRIEGKELAFHQRVRDGYLALAAESPHRWRKLEGTASEDKIHEQIWSIIDSVWPR